MHYAKYFAAFLVPGVVGLSLALPGGWSFLAVAVLFGVFPVLELFLTGTDDNLSIEEEESVRVQRRYDLILYAIVPIQFALLGWYLYLVSFTELTTIEFIGNTMAMGMACGILGINVGHELGHRRKKSEQNMAKALLLSTLYMHFFIEHNRGHHAKVATEHDPASSRFGESLYAYFPRTIIHSYMDAWKLESERLEKQDKGWLTWENEMVGFTAIQLAFTATIFAVFGLVGGLAFVLAAFVGALLLETVNYIEHYGLERAQLANGRYERVQPVHSWNSNHTLGRLVLFELTRHSDHHANARRKYQTLRHFDESPQLPTGYPGMMVLAWFPPLWFAVMHRHLDLYRDRMNAASDAALAPAE